MKLILLIFIVLFIYSYYLEKRVNWKNRKDTINHDIRDSTESTNALEQIESWQLYSGTLMYMPAYLKADYLQSNKWKELKLSALSIADDKCECCGNSKQLELHHITYERLTQERAIDMAIVCRNCHQQIHSKLGYDRATKYPIH